MQKTSLDGFGKICIAELAGEIGTTDRFAGERSLALNVGMSPLTDDSGKYRGSKIPRQVNLWPVTLIVCLVSKTYYTVFGFRV